MFIDVISPKFSCVPVVAPVRDLWSSTRSGAFYDCDSLSNRVSLKISLASLINSSPTRFVFDEKDVDFPAAHQGFPRRLERIDSDVQ